MPSTGSSACHRSASRMSAGPGAGEVDVAADEHADDAGEEGPEQRDADEDVDGPPRQAPPALDEERCRRSHAATSTEPSVPASSAVRSRNRSSSEAATGASSATQ